MKQLKHRTLFVLFFIGALCVGMVFLLGSYVINGASWAAFRANSHVYTDGTLDSGGIYDRNGEVLYDCATGSYNDDPVIRTATLHAVGDETGNVATGAKTIFSSYLVGFNAIFGTNGTGNKVNLTIDAQLNKTAYEALEGRKGTVALYNYDTGELLCMVSAPAFDPTDTDLVEQILSGETSGYEGAFLNRFLSSTYTPGSTFKVVTSAAALETLGNMDDFTYDCDGAKYYSGSDHAVTCPSAHGSLNFDSALWNSCNGAFATLANEVGSETLKEYAQKAGLLDSVTVSGLSSAKGSFDTTDTPLDEGWSGVGQYHDLVNPCAELTLMGCIAGGGSAATPRLLGSVTGSKLGLPAARVETETSTIGWESSTCQTLKTMMRNNVLEHYGQDQFGELPVCAKSGTAEVGDEVDPHAWFVGFVDSEEYPYAFVVVVENGGWGSSVAGGIAATVLEAACS